MAVRQVVAVGTSLAAKHKWSASEVTVTGHDWTEGRQGDAGHANAKLKRSLDDAPIGLCYIDIDLRFVHINEWLAKINGLPAEAHIGKTLGELLPHLADGVEPLFRQVIDGGEPILAGTVEAETAAHPGVKHTYEHYYYPDVGADGAVVGVSCVVLDITERKRVEGERRESLALLVQAEELSNTGAWQWDIGKDEWAFSEEWLAIHGCHARKLTSEELLPISHPEDQERIAAAFEQVRTGSRPYDVEHRIIRQDTGEIRVVHARGKLVRDENGEPWKVLGAAQDVTERRQVEKELEQHRKDLEGRVEERTQELRESEARLRCILDHSPALISTKDLDGNITLVNRRFEVLAGPGREEWVGKSVHDFFPGDVADALRESDLAAREGPIEAEETVEHRGGAFHTYLTVKFPLVDDEKGLFGTGAVSTDITERKRMEAERREFEEQMQQTQKLESLGVMAGGIAHDFNNILFAILGNAEMALTEMAPGAIGRDRLGQIQIAARRASALTDQMLVYSGKSALTIEKIDLSALVQEMAHLLEVSHGKKTVLKYRFEEDLPVIRGDPSQLRQVVMNLIANAADAEGDEGGTITLTTAVTEFTREQLASTYLREELPGGRYVYMEVSDTGCGMGDEELRRVFEPFFTTKFTGRGLGMAAVLGIVRAHKGAIDVRSEVGRGTSVKVLLPALDHAVETRREEAQREEAWTAHGTVLVVDDEPQVRDLLKVVLERKGFSVLTAEDGRQAVGVFRKHMDEVVCVLLDLTMPQMSGEETFVEMRQIREDVPIVLLSGYSEGQLEETVEHLGFAGFLKKPLGSRELLEAVRSVLKSDRGAAAAGA